jgi:hypothetical protein
MSLISKSLVFTLVVSLNGLFADTLLKITKPLKGAIVHPGETVEIAVSATGGPMESVTIFVPGNDQSNLPLLSSPPYQFLYTVPSIPMQILPGLHPITAAGRAAGAPPVFSEPVEIDVERPDSPQWIKIDHPGLELKIGHEIPIEVYGTYADGSIVPLSRSTRTKFKPTREGIVSVSWDGNVAALAVGSTTIVVRHQNCETSIKAVVTSDRK